MIVKKQHSGISTNFATAASARTIELKETDGMQQITGVGFQFNITHGSGGTIVATVTVFKSADGGSTYAAVPAYTYAGSGAYGADDYSVTKSISASTDDLWVDIDTTNCNAVKVIIATDTASADDTVIGKVCSSYHKAG